METDNQPPVLTFEGKRYDLNTLPDEMKELVRGMQVADAQLRMHEDTLKVLAAPAPIRPRNSRRSRAIRRLGSWIHHCGRAIEAPQCLWAEGFPFGSGPIAD